MAIFFRIRSTCGAATRDQLTAWAQEVHRTSSISTQAPRAARSIFWIFGRPDIGSTSEFQYWNSLSKKNIRNGVQSGSCGTSRTKLTGSSTVHPDVRNTMEPISPRCLGERWLALRIAEPRNGPSGKALLGESFLELRKEEQEEGRARASRNY